MVNVFRIFEYFSILLLSISLRLLKTQSHIKKITQKNEKYCNNLYQCFKAKMY
jgi:hypothetical protein